MTSKVLSFEVTSSVSVGHSDAYLRVLQSASVDAGAKVRLL